MYNEKGILWKSILEIQGIPLIVIPYRYGVLTFDNKKRPPRGGMVFFTFFTMLLSQSLLLEALPSPSFNFW